MYNSHGFDNDETKLEAWHPGEELPTFSTYKCNFYNLLWIN
jgi:hypothetical protein